MEADDLEGLEPVGRADDLVARAPQGDGQDHVDVDLVVHHQDAGGGHAPTPLRGSFERIALSRSAELNGLVRQTVAPSTRGSPGSTSIALSTTTGVSRVSGCSRRSRIASKPSRSGSIRSIVIASGWR